MINAEQAKQYTKEFVPNERFQREVLDEIERKIKAGDRHPFAFTTGWCRNYAEDAAKYCREKLGFTNARIEDIYSIYGQRGGNYLQIDL